MSDDPDPHNLIRGNVDGSMAQIARDVHGNIYFGSGPTERPTPRQLPPTPPNFVGRSTQLAGLTAMAEQSCAPIVVSHPAKGIGKTTLVAKWATAQAERFPDGMLYFNLRGSEWPGVSRRWEDVVRDVLHAFGVSPTPSSRSDRAGVEPAAFTRLVELSFTIAQAAVAVILTAGTLLLVRGKRA